MKPKVLVLEDEAPLNDLYSRLLRRMQFEVDQAYTLAEAQERLDRQRYDFFIVDIRLPDGIATTLLQAYQQRLREQGTEVIILTAEARYRPELEALGFDYYFEKPISLQMLGTFLQRLWKSRHPDEA